MKHSYTEQRTEFLNHSLVYLTTLTLILIIIIILVLILIIGSWGVDGNILAQERDRWPAVVNTVKNHSICKSGGKFLNYLRYCQCVQKEPSSWCYLVS